MTAKPQYNPPAAQLALWKSYLDKNGGHIRKAHSQLPEPKPSYAVFLRICNKAFGLSPLQLARQKGKNESPDVFPVVAKRKLTMVQPFRSAPAVPIDGIHPVKDERDKKIVELIFSAVKDGSMGGDEFMGFVKGLLTGFGLR